MTEILNDSSNTEMVIKAIESNMFSFWMQYGEAVTEGNLLYFTSSLPHPLFNAVFAAQLTNNEIEPTINRMVAHYRARKLPFFWWTGPQTRPSDLGEHLKQQGFQGGGYTPGMAVELNVLPQNGLMLDDFTIEIVKDEAALRQWVHVVTISNEIHSSLNDPLYKLELKRGFDKQRYLGKLANEAVGASILHMDDGVAGIYAVATLPEVRGKGIGAAMTLQPLLDAQKMGFKIGVLQSSPMGYTVYKRLGFKDYCELELFIYQPE